MLLELEAVRKVYRRGEEDVVAVAGVDLRVDHGELVSIVGPSGSGKSTLLHLAGGLDAPDEGTVRLDGEDLGSMSPADRARARRQLVGFVFQFFHLLPALSVAENVELPLLLDGRDAGPRVGELLDRVGLADRAAHRPAQLSGGERQRVAIARALVSRPPLILADEPTGNLDSTTGGAILDLLVEAVTDTGSTLVMVTHDLPAAGRARRQLAFRDGRFETAGVTGRERRAQGDVPDVGVPAGTVGGAGTTS